MSGRTTGIDTGAYLLWQAPWGFAGWGPAVEVLGSGIMHVWEQATGQTPFQTANWDREIQLSPGEVEMLLERLAQVDFAALPHPTDGWVECYPRLYLRLCSDCPMRTLEYMLASQLQPEMNEVYAWFDERLGQDAYVSPSGYCMWAFGR